MRRLWEILRGRVYPHPPLLEALLGGGGGHKLIENHLNHTYLYFTTFIQIEPHLGQIYFVQLKVRRKICDFFLEMFKTFGIQRVPQLQCLGFKKN